MKISLRIRAYINKYEDALHTNGDPIEAAKKLISSIQQLVGIHNVFGDRNRNSSVRSLFAAMLFAGAFIYVGPFSQSVYLIQVISDTTETFKAMNCISATCVPLSKFIFMWTSRDRLKTIFKMSNKGLLSISEGTLARTKIMDTLQKARYASIVVIVNQIFIHFIYLLMPFLFTVFGNGKYLPTTPGDSFGLSPKYETPNFEITFILTCFATMFSAVNQTGYIVLFVNLLANDLGHFYAITETLNHIYEKLSSERSITNEGEIKKLKRIQKDILFCVKHHQFLQKYHEKIRELYKVIFGAHFLMMIIVLVTTLQTMNSWDIRNTLLTGLTGIMPLFIYCFGGEMLLNAGLEMSTAIYSCGWELMKVKEAKMVLLMLRLSQQPLYLTAADIFVMNRETFGDVAQVIYKIYAVFN